MIHQFSIRQIYENYTMHKPNKYVNGFVCNKITHYNHKNDKNIASSKAICMYRLNSLTFVSCQ